MKYCIGIEKKYLIVIKSVIVYEKNRNTLLFYKLITAPKKYINVIAYLCALSKERKNDKINYLAALEANTLWLPKKKIALFQIFIKHQSCCEKHNLATYLSRSAGCNWTVWCTFCQSLMLHRGLKSKTSNCKYYNTVVCTLKMK